MFQRTSHQFSHSLSYANNNFLNPNIILINPNIMMIHTYDSKRKIINNKKRREQINTKQNDNDGEQPLNENEMEGLGSFTLLM